VVFAKTLQASSEPLRTILCHVIPKF